MMLKEGWDVRNVTTIVGLRAYAAKSNILPEQTLGRGLRKMYPGREEEFVSVMGTAAFMDFVESIQAEGVVLERRAMGEGTGGNDPVLVEVDSENPQKNLDELDIEIPVLTPRTYREYKNLDELNAAAMECHPVEYRRFSAEEQREIVFKDITTGEITHTTLLDGAGVADYRSVLAYFSRQIMKDLRLVSGYDAIYGRVKEFVRDRLFGHTIELEDGNTLRNLSELAASKTLQETFHKAINALTVRDQGNAEVRHTIKLRDTRPFVAKQQAYLVPKKSVFNKIIGDSDFELRFAAFLDACEDVAAHGKNLLAVGFKLDYVMENGDIGHYIPDFFVKLTDGRIFIVETKGQRDWEVPNKLERLRQWCEDANRAQSREAFDFAFVDQESFEKFKPTTFRAVAEGFREYKESTAGVGAGTSGSLESISPKKLKAISLRQPWAEAIMRGGKTKEYRHMMTQHRGPVYIYASLGRVDPEQEAEWAEQHGVDVESLPRGVVVGTVNITGCVEEVGDVFAWTLENPQRLSQPIPPLEKPQPVWFHPFGRP